MLNSWRLASRWQVRRWRAGAAQGDLVHMFNLAVALDHLARNDEAEHWYRRVALTGDVEAFSCLGVLLVTTGRQTEGLRYLTRAAEQGSAEAIAWLALR